jgi:hypothetical protein
MVAQVIEGAAKPVGGDSEATIQLNTPDKPAEVGPPEDQRKRQTTKAKG